MGIEVQIFPFLIFSHCSSDKEDFLYFLKHFRTYITVLFLKSNDKHFFRFIAWARNHHCGLSFCKQLYLFTSRKLRFNFIDTNLINRFISWMKISGIIDPLSFQAWHGVVSHVLDEDTVPFFIGKKGAGLPSLKYHEILQVNGRGIDAPTFFFIVPKSIRPFSYLDYTTFYYNDVAKFNNAVRAAKLKSQSIIESFMLN